MSDTPVRERLDLKSEEGKALLAANARAVGNEDVQIARETSIALTEGEGGMILPTEAELLNPTVTREVPLTSDEEYGTAQKEIPTDEYYKSTAASLDKETIVSRSVYGALSANSGDILTSFKMIEDELSLVGESPTYQEIADNVRDDARFELSGVIEDTAMLGSVEEVNRLIAAAPVILDERSNVRLSALDNASENQSVKDQSLRGQEYQAWYRERFEERINGRALVNKVISASLAEGSLDLADNIADLAGTLLVSEQLFLSRAAKKILGEHYFALGGDMKRDMATWILEPSSAKEQEERAKQVADAITDAAGFKGSNDVVKAFALEAIREYVSEPPAGIDWFRAIDNIAGVVGVVPFISEAVIAKGLRTLFSVRKVANSSGRSSKVLNDIQEADPDLASKLNVGALVDNTMSESLNITHVDATKRTLPHGAFSDDVHLEGAPQQLIDDLKGSQTRADQIDNYIENTYLFSGADYKAAERKILDILDAEKITGIAKPSITTMRREGNKIKLKVVYGADETNYPIDTIEKVTELKELLEKRFKDLREVELNTSSLKVTPKAKILVKDEVTGAFVTPDAATVSTKPRYYVSIDQDMPMLFDDIVPDTTPTKQVGKLIKWARSPIDYISKNVIGAATIANEKKSFVAHELRDIAKPFLSLKHRSKVRVVDLLTTGEDESKVFKYKDLEGTYTPEEIKGYFSTRQFNETVYRIKNNDMHNQLKRDGFKAISINIDDDIYQNAGKPLTAEQASKFGIAFDPRTKSSVDLKGTNAAKLYEDGQVVVKLKTRLQNGGNHFTHAVVNEADIVDLPTNVMPYRIGYNMRVNNDPYFIEAKFTVKLDGKNQQITKIVGVGENSHQATKWVDDLRASDATKQYSFRLDRNVSSSESLLKQEYDLLDGSGPQFWYSKRGDRLQRQDGSLSSVQDPVASIHNISQSVANTVTHKDMFDATITRHQKTYGGIEIDGKPLWRYQPEMKDYKYFGKEINESVHPEVKAANREYEYIESLKEMPVGVDLVWKELMLGIDRSVASSKMASKFSKVVVLDGLADFGPTQVLRNTTFMLTIPVRPIKQLALQWTTGLSLVGIDPGATFRAFQGSGLMNASMAAWDNPARWNKFIKPAAKALGYEADEWAEIFKQFRRTGKSYSIDSNVMISEANFGWSRSMPSSSLGRLGQTVRNAAIAPITLGKRLGFDLGELGNQSMSYVFARERWIKANPNKVWNGNQQNLDEIARAARNFSIDMTKTNLLPYQRGGFATLTQFMSINHKMAIRLLGADPDVQGPAHKRFIAGMVVMYGAAGLGLQDYYEELKIKEGLTIPESLDDLAYGGLVQFMFNKSLDMAFGEPFGTTRLAVSDAFSPAAGSVNFPFELVESIWESENIAEAISGPSGHTFPRIGRAADHINAIWGRKDFDTEEKLLAAGHAALSEFGFFSDRFNYNLAMSYKEKMDTYNVINRKGLIGVPSNQSELFGKMLLGLQTRSEGEFYNIILKLNSEVAASTKGTQTEIESDATKLAEWWWRQYLTSNQDEKVFEDNVKPIMNALNNGGDRLYNEQVLKLARKKLRLKPDFEGLLTGIVQKHKILDPEADMEMLRNVLNHTSIVDDEAKARNNRFLDEMEQNVENARRILDEEGDF